LPEHWSEEALEAKLFGQQPVSPRAVKQRPQPDWKTIHSLRSLVCTDIK